MGRPNCRRKGWRGRDEAGPQRRGKEGEDKAQGNACFKMSLKKKITQLSFDVALTLCTLKNYVLVIFIFDVQARRASRSLGASI